jgi:transcriptional regulator with GAF, ATPase, and Fis domain
MVSDVDEWIELATGLADMARDLLAQDSVQATLDRIVFHAVALIDGCEAAGILTVRRGQVETLACTDDVVRVSDRLQQDVTEGPCFDAERDKKQVYRIEDMTGHVHRWPRYAPRAAELGIGSMMGFLLYTRDERDLGALDLYSSEPGAFTERFEHVGWLLAAHASVALATANHEENMNHALITRQVIGEATGIVMARYALSEREAFARITRHSQDNNVKVRKLAEAINMIGDLPATGR